MFTVVHAFEPEFEDELRCAEGDTLEGLSPDGEDWYFCRNVTSGATGIVPLVNLERGTRGGAVPSGMV